LQDGAIVGTRVNVLRIWVVSEGSDEFVVTLEDACRSVGIVGVKVSNVTVEVNGEDVVALPQGS
jgi:hypothetical protein